MPVGLTRSRRDSRRTTDNHMNQARKIVLAYSGGLDTSYCIPYLREQKGFEVVTVTVDTGGFDAAELAEIEERSSSLGAIEHYTIDARQEVFDRWVSYLSLIHI